MRRTVNSIFSFLLCFILLFNDVPAAFAQDAPEEDSAVPGAASEDADDTDEAEEEESVSGSSVAIPHPTPVPADTPDTEEVFYGQADVSDQLIQAGGHPVFAQECDDDIVYAADTAAAKKAILNGLTSFESEIDLSSCQIPEDKIAPIFSAVVNANPELFYVTGAFSYSYDYMNIVLSIEPEYSSYYTQESVEIFNEKVDGILKSISSSATDLEKLLVLHEYMVTNIEYDYSQSKPGIYDAYGSLVKGLAVCQGYSEGYHCLLKKAGITCKVVYSDELKHTWNLVKLGGKWYYVDVTFDDPETTDTFYCRHVNFLRSRDGMVDTGHNSTDWMDTEDGVNAYAAYAGATTYDSFFWSDILRPIPVAGGCAAYYSAGKLNIYNLSGSGVKQVTPQGSCTSITSVAGVFYYSSLSSIYALTTAGKMSKCYTLNATESSYGSIYELTPESYGVRFHIMKAQYTAVLYTSVYVIDGLPVPTGVTTPSPTKSPTVTPTKAVTLTPTPTAVPTAAGKSLEITFAGGGRYVYTGTAVKPRVNVFYGGTLLKEDIDYSLKFSNNVNAGENALVVINGITLPFTAERNFVITQKSIADEDVRALDMRLAEGSKVSEPVIFYGSIKLGKKDISYDDSLIYDKDGVLSVSGNGNYTGTKNINVSIGETVKNGIKVSLNPVEHVYNGMQQKLSASELKVYDAKTGEELIQDWDYTVVYPGDIVNAGVKKIKVIGIGDYSGSVDKNYKIVPKKSGKISIGGPKSVEYVQGGVRPVVSVTIDGEKLEAGRDYKIKYASNKSTGSGRYTISFLGNYKGLAKRTGYFAIKQAVLDKGGYMIIPDMTFTKEGKYFSKPVVVKDNKVVPASQYDVAYSVNGQKLQASDKLSEANLNEKGELKIDVVVTGKGNYSGSLSGSFMLRKADKEHDISKASVSIVNKETGKKTGTYGYTGNPIVIGGDDEIVVTIGKDKVPLDPGNYTVKYAANVDKGKAYILITGKGAYAGSKKINFKIVKGKL